MKKVRALRRWMLSMSIMGGGGDEVKPLIVKAKIPNAWFTKKGPGVEAETRRAFADMTPGQQAFAVGAGWIPERWLSCLKRRNKK